jgi:hypothetical protein
MQPEESAPKQESLVTLSDSFSWKRTAIAITITAILTGTVGYILGVHTTSSISQNAAKALFQPSPTTMAQSSPSPVLTSITLPTVDPSVTANWKTYANTNCGYSFKYPAIVSFEFASGMENECPDESERIYISYKIDSSNPDKVNAFPGGLWMEFAHRSNRDNETFSDFLQSQGEPDGCCVIDLSTGKSIRVNNLHGYLASVPDLGIQRYYFPLRQNSIFLSIDIAEGSDSQLVNGIIGSLQRIE